MVTQGRPIIQRMMARQTNLAVAGKGLRTMGPGTPPPAPKTSAVEANSTLYGPGLRLWIRLRLTWPRGFLTILRVLCVRAHGFRREDGA